MLHPLKIQQDIQALYKKLHEVDQSLSHLHISILSLWGQIPNLQNLESHQQNISAQRNLNHLSRLHDQADQLGYQRKAHY